MVLVLSSHFVQIEFSATAGATEESVEITANKTFNANLVQPRRAYFFLDIFITSQKITAGA
jgi:hypothetical protein